MARPMPFDEPVMSARRPRRLRSISLFPLPKFAATISAIPVCKTGKHAGVKRIATGLGGSAVRFSKAFMCLLLGAAALLPGASHAQDYPNRPVRVIVGFPPGGGTDVAARVVTQEMGKSLGQSFLIENKPGAAGSLGAAEAARSAPDGYTLLVTPGGHPIFGAIFKNLPFHTVNSFDWISNIITIPFFIVVPANSEYKTLTDVIAKAK